MKIAIVAHSQTKSQRKENLFILRKRYAKEVLGCDKIYTLSARCGLIDSDTCVVKMFDSPIEWECQIVTEYLMKIYRPLMSGEEIEIYLFDSDSNRMKKFRQITAIDYDVKWFCANSKLYLGRGLRDAKKEAQKLSKKLPWGEIYGEK